LDKDQFERIYQLVMVGQLAPALDLADAALVADPADLEALLVRIKVLRLQHRLDEAEAQARAAAPLVEQTGNPVARAELTFESGLVLQERGMLAGALDHFRKAAALQDNVVYFSAICDTLCKLDRNEEAIEWRHKVLQIRNAEVSCAPADVVAAPRPRAFDPTRPERNIVSYCLFGKDPYYHECAITNARTNPVMFPEFTARFYCSPDLPRNVLKALDAAGAQILIPQAAAKSAASPMAGTLWRFLTFDDPQVDVVMCRDVDSPILPRERAAIEMWLASDKPFYCLRDHPIHAELILAGMWGGFTGLLPPLGPLASRIVAADHSRFADQKFLRQVIWPRLRDQAIMAIDAYGSLEGSVPFPPGHPKHGRLHVGISWTRKQILGAD
jgi:hypothetical protein